MLSFSVCIYFGVPRMLHTSPSLLAILFVLVLAFCSHVCVCLCVRRLRNAAGKDPGSQPGHRVPRPEGTSGGRRLPCGKSSLATATGWLRAGSRFFCCVLVVVLVLVVVAVAVRIVFAFLSMFLRFFLCMLGAMIS